MKRFTLLIPIFLFLFPAKAQVKFDYDYVVVGAGISGLSAAYNLNNYNGLVLEKNGRVGGRVHSKTYEGITYEMGAYSAYPSQLLPFEYDPGSLSPGNDSLGMLLNGKIIRCANPLECMFKGGFSVEDIESIQEFDGKNGIDFTRFPTWKIQMMNGFFNVVQSGDIREYNPKRQRDAFKKWTTDHYNNGNSALAYEYRSRLNAKVVLNAEVTRIKDYETYVEIEYLENNKKFTVTSKSVVVTTPAPITTKIIEDLKPEVNTMLEQVKFNPHAVYVMVLKGDKIKPFNYLTTPELQSSYILRGTTANSNLNVFYIHFSHDKSKFIEKFNQDKLNKTALEIMESTFGKSFSKELVVKTDFSFWKSAAVVVDPDYYERWERTIFHPSKRVFLAGDYLDIYGFPLGINAAVQSGLRAGKETFEFLRDE